MKKLAEVYRKAARRIERRTANFACLAIRVGDYRVGDMWPDELFEEMFHPTEEERQQYRTSVVAWMSCLDERWAEPVDEVADRDSRVLALCFAAAMAETGDL